jgi:hypothetical protein
LKPLHMVPYEFSHFKEVSVHIDYHVEYDQHFYSVPHQRRGEVVEIRATSSTIEILSQGKRIATHPRNFSESKRSSTLPEHQPKNHQQYGDWPPERLINWARTIGPSTAAMAEAIMASKKFPELGYRSCMGILRLSKKYPEARLEAACKRALSIRGLSFKSVNSILKSNLDQRSLAEKPPELAVVHANIRGASAFVPVQLNQKETPNADTPDDRQTESTEAPWDGQVPGMPTGTEGSP